jgi:hypothetical protein
LNPRPHGDIPMLLPSSYTKPFDGKICVKNLKNVNYDLIQTPFIM